MDDELAGSALVSMVFEAVDHEGHPAQWKEDHDENDHANDLELAEFGGDDCVLVGSALGAGGHDWVAVVFVHLDFGWGQGQVGVYVDSLLI